MIPNPPPSLPVPAPAAVAPIHLPAHEARGHAPVDSTSDHLPALDGVRGVAILMVLFWHYYSCSARPEWVKQIPLIELIAPYGWTGVPLFFVLSGLLIGRILLQRRGQPGYFRVFFIRRACRILPLYALLLASFAVARSLLPLEEHPAWTKLLGTEPPYWVYGLFLQNFVMAQTAELGGSWLGVTWSLAVEEQFYLILPVLVAILRPQRLPAMMVALVVMAVGFRWAVLEFGLGNPGSLIVLLPSRIDAFALGVLCALLLQRTAALRWPAWATIVSGGLCISLIHFGPRLQPESRILYLAVLYTLIALVFTILILHALYRRHGLLSRCLSWRPLCWCGSVSYSVYLFHEVVNHVMHLGFTGLPPNLGSPTALGLTLLSLALVLILGEVSRRTFEARFIQWGKRHRYGAAPTPSADERVRVARS